MTLSSASKRSVLHMMERLNMGVKHGVTISGIGSEPGFESYLRLSTLHDIDPINTTWEKHTLTTEYKAVPEVCGVNGKGLSLGTCIALIDQHTTIAVFGAKEKQMRAGVSVDLTAELFRPIPENSNLKIISKLTKMGRKMAFLTADIVDRDKDVLYCRGSHVKFLPMDSPLQDRLASNSWGFPLLKAYFDTIPEPECFTPNPNLETLSDILSLDNVQEDDHNGMMAEFCVLHRHTNPFATFHGGCQAILMESLSRQIAERDLSGPVDDIHLSSIQMQYLSALGVRGSHGSAANVEARILSQNSKNNEVATEVFMRKPKDGKVLSSGKLRWGNLPNSS